MAHVHLPTAHSLDDLVLAQLVIERFESDDLFVCWTHESGPRRRPEVLAELRPAAGPVVEALAVVTSWVSSLLEAARTLGRRPEPSRPADPPAVPDPHDLLR